MNPDVLTVRQWQEQYRAGTFELDSQEALDWAGWNDFYDPLNDRGLRNLCKLVMSITHPFVLDNYHVYFLHHTPGVGPMYGCVYFDLLSDEQSKKSFDIALDSPHERKKWVLETRRYGDGGPEFECGDIRGMSRYINDMAHELERDIQPGFIAEKQAVRLYTRFQGEPAGVRIYREGDHRYSYTSFQDGCQRMVVAADSLEKVPPGIQAGDAVPVGGLYVFFQEDVGKGIEINDINKKKSQKKKSEVER